jgi:hypothetical protein
MKNFIVPLGTGEQKGAFSNLKLFYDCIALMKTRKETKEKTKEFRLLLKFYFLHNKCDSS